MILHITTEEEWACSRSRGHHEAPSLTDEGFIHCSTPAQIAATANRFYAGREDLILLSIDPGKLAAEIKYENTEGGSELFPHVYGPIELAAVIDARPWRPEAGGFRAPPRIDAA